MHTCNRHDNKLYAHSYGIGSFLEGLIEPVYEIAAFNPTATTALIHQSIKQFMDIVLNDAEDAFRDLDFFVQGYKRAYGYTHQAVRGIVVSLCHGNISRCGLDDMKPSLEFVVHLPLLINGYVMCLIITKFALKSWWHKTVAKLVFDLTLVVITYIMAIMWRICCLIWWYLYYDWCENSHNLISLMLIKCPRVYLAPVDFIHVVNLSQPM